MHRHYSAWCTRDVHTRAFSLHHPGHIVSKLPFRLLHRHLLMCQHFKHNIYMGNYLTITRGNDIKTNQLMKG